jgi:small conductance mechanosensitive channel
METIRNFLENANLTPLLIGWAGKLALALLIYIIGKWVAKKIVNALRRLLKSREVDETLNEFLANIAYAVLLITVILAALDSLGLPITSLFAILGAAGLAVGLALKDSLGNFASGVMMVMFRPFGKGDYVEVAGVAGTVDEIRIFSTILVTPDNKQIIIPNGLINADTITNYSANDTRRVDMVFGVSYDDDLKLAREVLTRVCKNHPKVLDDPALKVFVMNLGDSSVDFAVRPWAKSGDYWTVKGDVLESAKLELEAAGLNLPYPQTDVHLHNVSQ